MAPGCQNALQSAARSILAALLLAAAAAAAYANSFNVPFLFDDGITIVQNPTIRNLADPGAVLHPPRLGTTTHGRPLTNLSFALNFALHGLNVHGYHLANLAIHVLNGWLLFGLTRRLAGRPRHTADAAAFTVALLWLVHPLCTQAVTYIVQRAESLAALLYLLTLYGIVRSAEDTRLRTPWACLSVGACALGMATKETLITAPVAALLLDRAFLSPSWRAVFNRRGWLHAAILCTATIQGAITLSEGRIAFELAQSQSRRETPWQYLLTQAGVIIHYLRLAACPNTLCFDYFGWPRQPTLRAALPSLTITAGLGLAAIGSWRRNPRLGFVAILFFLLLAPTSSIVPIADAVAEHRMYLPLATLCALAVLTGAHTWNRLMDNAGRWHHALPPAVTACLALLLGIHTCSRNADYQSSFSIWNDTATKRPSNARAICNRGIDHEQAGRTLAALRDYDLAAATNPLYAAPYFSRANLHLSEHRYDLAIRDCTRTLELAPSLLRPRYHRGLAYAATGRFADAIADYTACLTQDPALPQVWYARGNAFAQRECDREAVADYTRAIALDTTYADAYHNRAAAYAVLGEMNLARADLQACRALGLEPSPALIQLVGP